MALAAPRRKPFSRNDQSTLTPGGALVHFKGSTPDGPLKGVPAPGGLLNELWVRKMSSDPPELQFRELIYSRI